MFFPWRQKRLLLLLLGFCPRNVRSGFALGGAAFLSRRESIHLIGTTSTAFGWPSSSSSRAMMKKNTTTTTIAGEERSGSGSKPTPPVIRWGIVGLGDVTQQKSGPAFWKCNGSALVAVMRRTPGRAAEWAKRVPLDNSIAPCVGYENLDDFLSHEGLDAVYIASRPGSHCEIFRKVAATPALKAVYVEKPVGRCAEETRGMQDMAMKNKNKRFYTAYISRAYPRTQAVRDLLQQGVVGDQVTDIFYRLKGTGGARDMDGDGSSIPWRLDAAQSGGGLIMDVGCHVLDRIDYLCGPLEQVLQHAVAEKRQRVPAGSCVEDYVHFEATIGPCNWAALPSEGARVSCTWEFFTDDDEEVDALEIRGPKGSLRMAAMSASLPIQVLDQTGKLRNELTFEQPEHTAQAMVQAITDELSSRGSASCISRADNAIRTSQVLDQALEGYYGNRRIGYWNDPDSWPGYTKYLARQQKE